VAIMVSFYERPRVLLFRPIGMATSPMLYCAVSRRDVSNLSEDAEAVLPTTFQ
jgi:hypothetical protein